MTYSSSIALGRQRYGGKNRNLTGQRSQERTLGPVSNTVLLIVLACILGLIYLTQVTKTNAFGYQINELQSQQASLQEQHDELLVSEARLRSLDRVEQSDVAKNLVTVAPSDTLQR
ncbi:MAG: hypothetical protein U5L95_03770 [Candidatus Saccharibacteria bacterium]|nr:hypothetical protein [Candidatus Saccharibacteria bacterium]